MQERIRDTSDFLKNQAKHKGVILDVRSSMEYKKAHIPGAISLPLLDDEHRVIIGTIYKEKGREAAVLKGFELVGPLFHEKIKKAIDLAPQKQVFIYCWRGGMRSNIMAWLLKMAGFKVHLLEGGYKSFRHWALMQFTTLSNILVLGGKTGSGKTEMLALLKTKGEQVIDLEGLANHRGSAYGSLGLPAQPTQEHFGNLLAFEISKMNLQKRVWIENESRAIGKVNVPNEIFEIIRKTKVVEMEVPIQIRKERILKEYGVFSVEDLAEKTEKIAKRLGGLNLKNALTCLYQDDMEGWLEIILWYYDKTYSHSNDLRKPEEVSKVEILWSDPENEVRKIINLTSDIN